MTHNELINGKQVFESKYSQYHQAFSSGKSSREDVSIRNSLEDPKTPLAEYLPVMNRILSGATINTVKIYVNKTYYISSTIGAAAILVCQ